MEQKKINNFVNKFLIIFLVIQPIFDIKIFYNSTSTLIRVVIIFTIFMYYFFTSKNKKKYFFLIYPCILGIYFAFHHLNALNFNSLVPGKFNYSIIKELLYFAKMVTPYLLIYSLYKSKIEKEKILKIIQIIVLIITLTIIVTNLLGISYGNYSDIRIKANFLKWFEKENTYTYMDLASKGIFEYGNQIGAILAMFLPFAIYKAVEKKVFINVFTVICNVFALILLCTRVSILSVFIVITYTFFVFTFIAIIQGKRFAFKAYAPIFVVLILHSVLLPINPMFNRLNEREQVIEAFNEEQKYAEKEESAGEGLNLGQENIQEVEQLEKLEPIKKETNFMIQYIEENYEKKKLHKQFLFENYPYIYDYEFWYNFLQKDISLTTDYRYIETEMIKRVVEINNNKWDKLFGITNTRLQNIFNIEKDFVVQYYALGIIGLILIFLPYLLILTKFVYETICKKLKNLDEVKVLAGITIMFIFCISYFSGNMLNSLSFTIYFSLFFYLLKG